VKTWRPFIQSLKSFSRWFLSLKLHGFRGLTHLGEMISFGKNMKKLLIIATILCFAQVCIAQHFTLTPEGFVSENKSNYTVVNVPNVKQADLYKNAVNAISSMYKDPKKVLSLVEGESITVRGYEENAIQFKDKLSPIQIGKATVKYDISYTITMLFKDGRIRLNAPTFECRRWIESQRYTSGWGYLHLKRQKSSQTGIYDQKGKIISQEAYDAVNTYLNALLKEILEKSNKINNW